MIGIGAPDVRGAWVGLNKALFTEIDNTERFFIRNGPRKITTDVTIRVFRWGEPGLKLTDAGYNHSAKMRQLQEIYYPTESMDVAFAKLREKNAGKTTSLALHMRGVKDKFLASPTTKGPCLQYLNFVYLKGKLKKVHIHYRTTEVTKKFFADLVFLDSVLDRYAGRDKLFCEVWFHIPLAYCHTNQFPVIDIIYPNWKQEWKWQDKETYTEVYQYLTRLLKNGETAIAKWGMVRRTGEWYIKQQGGKKNA